ncbi:tRNA (adenosine(37)-N6)-threonylcarbamoyltransferase complex dimerization subunit type 1 TsaB [Gracilimonas sp.]|uniref:tRNA (adenosine(37)-N6)-threonylcarbamoyltransferase complex dimerization subunit type 1 TsaB n=1 Tax=Gracilimonas sp. TaxID=1974203 RepID=UPI0028710B28|nr:tRNA (adenosine(37)-N6)-threonylcarbamoyltransferase complex dimerization subunit type 1 TsaB [Gracilimonas sp.]
MILAIETATNICSISFQDGEGKLFEKRTERKGSHSELLFIFIRELMEEHNFKLADLDIILVSSGPGSYTGLRIAASAVKGLFFGLNVDIYAGNTLAGFAQGAGEGTVHAVINARRKHLYHQKFKKEDRLIPITKSEILELVEITALMNKGNQIIGTGIERLEEEKKDQLTVLEASDISATNLIHLFNSISGEEFFQKTTAEELESNYLSSSQVNNTKVK